MSEIKQAADLEAAIAEAELSDEEGERVQAIVVEGIPVEEAIALVVAEREGETPEEPAEPPAEPESDEPTRKQLKALDAEQTRHERRVHEIMGVFVAGFTACEACGGVGLTPPGPPPPEPQTHEFFKACETCAGFGQVRTGSLRPGEEARDCPACRGRGYLELLDAQGQPRAEANGAPPAQVAPPPLEIAAGNGESAATGPTYGVPAWMGDPNLSRA